mmetsp:Transcript_9531/g.22596  ORF Transcript_9531/g.22596 Transcript_9531/m.22596 type:complete len:204 (-) Transcript_9531:534-1145(-)
MPPDEILVMRCAKWNSDVLMKHISLYCIAPGWFPRRSRSSRPARSTKVTALWQELMGASWMVTRRSLPSFGAASGSCSYLKLKKAWLREDREFMVVAATVRIWLPKFKSSITSSAELTTDNVSPSIRAPCFGWQCTFLGFCEVPPGCSRSLICSLYTSKNSQVHRHVSGRGASSCSEKSSQRKRGKSPAAAPRLEPAASPSIV